MWGVSVWEGGCGWGGCGCGWMGGHNNLSRHISHNHNHGTNTVYIYHILQELDTQLDLDNIVAGAVVPTAGNAVSGEWGVGGGEWGVGSRQWGVGSGEWGVGACVCVRVVRVRVWVGVRVYIGLLLLCHD